MSDKLTIKPRKLKHLQVGQVWRQDQSNPLFGNRYIYYELIKKKGNHWHIRAIIVGKRFKNEKTLMWPGDETDLKRWDLHEAGGVIARDWKYITNNKDIFLKNYNILYSNK